jgi:hypothetical protein
VVVAEPLAIAVQASILNPGAKLKRNDCKAGMSAKASLICLPRREPLCKSVSFSF